MQNAIARGWKFFLCLTVFVLCVPAMRAQSDAEKTYKAKCAGCHAPDGSGATPAGKAMGIHDLHSAEVQKQTDAELSGIISHGKGKMPKYADKLKAEEIKQLVAYIRGLSKGS